MKDLALTSVLPDMNELLMKEQISESQRVVIYTHLTSPEKSSEVLMRELNVSLEEVKHAYKLIKEDTAIVDYIHSLYYHKRLFYQSANTIIKGWLTKPDNFSKLISGQPIVPDVLEVHSTKGTCNYSCTMCLWSDKNELTYTSKGLDIQGLMTFDEWKQLFDEANILGVKTIVFSGGGEFFQNRDAGDLIDYVSSLGMIIHIYSNGFNLEKLNHNIWGSLKKAEQFRFSLHSPRPTTYNQITGMPEKVQALENVINNVAKLRNAREEGSLLRIGIGFVIQPMNYSEILEMCDFSRDLGVDFLCIRKDEVDVTEGFSEIEFEIIRNQLIQIREQNNNGFYGNTTIDISDELVAWMDGLMPNKSRVSQCYVKYTRPTVSPYGIFAPCDLKAEPRFASSNYNLGNLKDQSLSKVADSLLEYFIPDKCNQCMPSSRTVNAIYDKLMNDCKLGIALEEQPFLIS